MQGIPLKDDQREAIRTLREQGFTIRESSHQESALTSGLTSEVGSGVRSCRLTKRLGNGQKP
jgi:hypothetical protein